MQKLKTLASLVLFSANVYAQDVEIVGTVDHIAKTPKIKSLTGKAETKHLQLIKVKLSPKAKKVLENRALKIQKNQKLSFASHLPKKVSLGMNNVPVLDQGKFGSCVTFANTVALDAAINKGDYISQVCQLQLGAYLSQNGYSPNGWGGSLGRTVLSQIETFGIINKQNQETLGCGGLNHYPSDEEADSILNSTINLDEFHKMSENMTKSNVIWSPILDVYQAVLERTDTNKTLDQIKTALNENDRVTFGVFLFDLDIGFMGAAGTHKSKYDTWTLTPVIARDLFLSQPMGAHEMVITGYDDDAITTDDEGNQYKGLLTLRNSWSEKHGDKGDFYMTYDYFRALVMEAQRIRSLPASLDEEMNPNIG